MWLLTLWSIQKYINSCTTLTYGKETKLKYCTCVESHCRCFSGFLWAWHWLHSVLYMQSYSRTLAPKNPNGTVLISGQMMVGQKFIREPLSAFVGYDKNEWKCLRLNSSNIEQKYNVWRRHFYWNYATTWCKVKQLHTYEDVCTDTMGHSFW